MADLRALAQALVEAGQAMDDPGPQGELEGTLEAIARTARDAVPGFDHVGIAVVRGDGTVATMASTGQLVREMDTLQYKFDQGPCLDALRREGLVLAEDISAQADNWPMYAPRASQAGVRAQMGMRLRSTQQTLGGMNFYSTAADSIDSRAPHRAEFFATHAAIALAHARHVDVREAVGSPQFIGQAVGILMERFEITEDRALYLLVRVAAAGELELRALAREMVDRVSARANRLAEADEPRC
jgi:GAF domain-containing protein